VLEVALHLVVVRQYCFLASASSESQAAIGQAGAIAPLAHLLKHKEAQTREEAAEALSSLARNNERNQEAISQAGVSSDVLS